MRTSADIVNERRISFGPKDTMMNMAASKYPWAVEIYDRMESNNWSHRTISMVDDTQCYREKLTPEMRRSFDCALAFTSNLDGIQFHNLSLNVGRCITDSDVELCIVRQSCEEGVHVKQYQTIAEATAYDKDAIYMMFERDGILAEKIAYITDNFDELGKAPTPENFAIGVVNNIIAEGQFFYSAFLKFFILGRNGLMRGTSDAIKYICRDEGGTHLDLFHNIHMTNRNERPELYDKAFYERADQMIRKGQELETKWSKYILGNGWLGATPELFEAFNKHRANVTSARVGIKAPYPEFIKNPVPWFDAYSQPNGSDTNSLERKHTDYQVGKFKF